MKKQGLGLSGNIVIIKPNAGQPFLGSPFHDFPALACSHVPAFTQFLHNIVLFISRPFAGKRITSRPWLGHNSIAKGKHRRSQLGVEASVYTYKFASGIGRQQPVA